MVVYVVRGQELLVFVGASGFGVPGGATEPGETLEEAAVREVEEETAGTRVRCRFVPLEAGLTLAGGRDLYLSSL